MLCDGQMALGESRELHGMSQRDEALILFWRMWHVDFLKSREWLADGEFTEYVAL